MVTTWASRPGLWFALVLTAQISCVYSGELLYRDASVQLPDAGVLEPAQPWGQYAAGLAIPACPASAFDPLIVDSLSGELDGGTGFSLWQALALAARRPGLDVIRFDAALFPVDAPATISLAFDASADVGPICLDGRERGVIIQFGLDSNIWSLGPGSLQVGLTLLSPPRQFVRDAQVAACRIGTDGVRALRSTSIWAVDVTGTSVIGPGNVFVGNTGIRVFDGPEVQVIENFFGSDPLTNASLPLQSGLDVSAQLRPLTLTVRGNTFAVSGAAFRADIPGLFGDVSSGSSASFSENRVLGGREGFGTVSAGRVVVGPRNIIRRAAIALTVGAAASVLLTQNSISDNDAGVIFTAGSPVPVPVIASVTAASVAGTCAVAGTIEVFADQQSQSAEYLGTTACDGVAAWVLPVVVTSGRNVTATLTQADAGPETLRKTSAFSAPVAAP